MYKQRILLIDNDKSYTRILKLNLESRGFFEVQEENIGSQALAAARKFKPDLILLDVMMPDIDGGEVAAQLKADFRLKTIPIVFLTAAASKQEVDGLEGSIGGQSFLAKPASTGEILDCLRKHIGRLPKISGLSDSTHQTTLSSHGTRVSNTTQQVRRLHGQKNGTTVPPRLYLPAMVVALAIGGYWGYQLYVQPQRLLQQTLAELQKSIQEQTATRDTAAEGINKAKALGDFQHKAAGILGAQISSKTNGYAPSSLLNDMAVSIVKLRCLVSSSATQTRRGSGILYRSKSSQSGMSPYFIQTSLHVVKTDDGSSPNCKIFLYPDHTKGDMYLLFKSQGFRFYRKDVDFAILEPEIVKDDIHAGSLEDLASLAREEARNPICKSTDIGDRLSILGYPTIGGETLTVTEGIISGFEFQGETRFIKSSAKLDHGNSGGLAIKSSGCVVGIPTFVQRGQLESMGRILDLNYLHKVTLN